MKLINPTDQELNAAFAEHVAGLDAKTISWLDDSNDINFTRSADAVMPWLEKHRVAPIAEYRPPARAPAFVGWEIMLEHGCNGRADTFPKAAVIALLRAHGHEVEFTT